MRASAQGGHKISAFEHWLRTRRRAPVEYKFNGWHDTHDGKFTEVGSGRYFPQGAPEASEPHSARRRQVRSRQLSNGDGMAPATESTISTGRTIAELRPIGSRLDGPAGNNAPIEAPYLTAVHNDILNRAGFHPPQAGTNEWTVDDFARWQLGTESLVNFKKQWVHGYRSAIEDAASRFGLPPELIAGTAFNEVGGDPQETDTLAYSLRNDPERDKTSFGNVSIQVRRAAEALGYDPGD